MAKKTPYNEYNFAQMLRHTHTHTHREREIVTWAGARTLDGRTYMQHGGKPRKKQEAKPYPTGPLKMEGFNGCRKTKVVGKEKRYQKKRRRKCLTTQQWWSPLVEATGALLAVKRTRW